MPRTIFDLQKHKYDKLMALLRGTAQVKEKRYVDLGAMAGCSAQTIMSRFRNPENMTIGELTSIGRGLCIPIEEIRQSIQY